MVSAETEGAIRDGCTVRSVRPPSRRGARCDDPSCGLIRDATIQTRRLPQVVFNDVEDNNTGDSNKLVTGNRPCVCGFVLGYS